MTHSKLAELQGIEEIVQDIKNGHTDRFEEIIEAYQQKLYAYCFRMLNHREEARDAVQDIFFKSFRNLHQYKQSVSFNSWLYKLAYRQCLNILRKRKSWLNLVSHYRRHMPKQESSMKDHLFVEELLQQLVPSDRNLFILRSLEGYEYAELSALLGITQGTARKRVERIRRQLKNFLAKEEEQSVEKLGYR